MRTGRGGLVGEIAVVLSWDGTEGRVRCHSEIWRAWAPNVQTPRAGDRVKVVGFDGLSLQVEPTLPEEP